MLCGLLRRTVPLLRTRSEPARPTSLDTLPSAERPVAVRATSARDVDGRAGSTAAVLAVAAVAPIPALALLRCPLPPFGVPFRRLMNPALARRRPPVVGLTPRGSDTSSGMYRSAAAPVGYLEVSVSTSGESGVGAMAGVRFGRGVGGAAYSVSGMESWAGAGEDVISGLGRWVVVGEYVSRVERWIVAGEYVSGVEH